MKIRPANLAGFPCRPQREQECRPLRLAIGLQLQPGERTGKFRLGKDHLLEDKEGQSAISREDFAIAIVDEIEKPKHVRKRFTAAY